MHISIPPRPPLSYLTLFVLGSQLSSFRYLFVPSSCGYSASSCTPHVHLTLHSMYISLGLELLLDRHCVNPFFMPVQSPVCDTHPLRGFPSCRSFRLCKVFFTYQISPPDLELIRNQYNSYCKIYPMAANGLSLVVFCGYKQIPIVGALLTVEMI